MVPFSEIDIPPIPNSNICGLDLFLPDNKQIRLLNIYRPTTKEKPEDFPKLVDTLFELCSIDHPVTITGDFNFPNLQWQKGIATNPNNKAEKLFHDFLTNFNFYQSVRSPTRQSNILDLIFSNEHIIYNLSTGPPFGLSDHNTITFDLKYSKKSQPDLLRSNFHKADYSALNNYFYSINWLTLFATSTNIDHLYSAFTGIVHQAINQFVPCSKGKPKFQLPLHIRKLDQYIKALWCKPRDPKLTKKISFLTKRKQHEIKKFCRYKERKYLARQDTRYKYTGSFLKSRNTKIPLLKDSNDQSITLNNSKANLLADQFSTNFTKSFTTSSTPTSNNNTETIMFCPIFQTQVLEKLLKLDNKNNTSSDLMPNILLKNCAHSLSFPISHIFSYSMMTSTVPAIWKQSIIIPIPKCPKSKKAIDFRPISLLCSLSKVLESIICSELNSFINKNHILPESQHGFCKSKSVTTNLLEYFDDISLATEQKKCVDSIYFDLSKAFDKVPHNNLLLKLHNMGIQGSLLQWIKNYLKKRTNIVKVEDSYSDSFDTLSGVPQGSILGPILFTLYISDLPTLCHVDDVQLNLYADDLKAYHIFDPNSPNTEPLQTFIDKFILYCSNNGLEIANDKCSSLHIGIKCQKHSYKINNHIISSVAPQQSIRDLGVLFSSNLKFTDHIDLIIKKGNKMTFAILRSIKSQDPKILINLFNTYIRSILEFASPIWSPHTKINIKKIEKIQKRFLFSVFRRIRDTHINKDRLETPSYIQLLELFKVETLEQRRKKIDLKLFHNIIWGFTRVKPSKAFNFKKSNTRGEQYKIYIKHCSTTARYNSFFVRTARLYQKLPYEIRNNHPGKFTKLLETTDTTLL